MMSKGFSVLLIALALCIPRTLPAQISPGELSKAHQALEGISNCTQCHESGQGLSNEKCLACHLEIKGQLQRKHGFHFANASVTCVTCHKEHLGREAAITRFDERGFDHAKTGFVLTGRHGALKCAQCHAEKNVKDPETKSVLAKSPHSTFLGLDGRCVSCHQDRHRGTVGTACQSCHGTDSWSPAAVFDHARTRFPLIGKHKSVACAQCHAGIADKTANEPMLFATKGFADCNTCHTSPHGRQFADKACNSCHTAEGWTMVVGFDHSKTRFPLAGKHTNVPCERCHTSMAQAVGKKVSFSTKPFTDCTPCHSSSHNQKILERACRSCHVAEGWAVSADLSFDHSLTRFVLKGKHRGLRCEQCHKPSPGATFTQRFLVAFNLCTDCHEDYHNGVFRETYSNRCEVCHNEEGFKPSTFTVEGHAKSRFELAGAHLAVPCYDCHRTTAGGTREFRFKSLRCESCHPDRHNGQFDKEMVTLSCARCHSTKTWAMSAFDHAKTNFPLVGRHLVVKCADCHKEQVVRGVKQVQYIGVATDCQSCHKDVHGRQFDEGGETRCITCHSPRNWHVLVFNHDLQSSFPLTGAHKNVLCGGCHKEDRIGGATIVRYRPVPTACESCHRGKM